MTGSASPAGRPMFVTKPVVADRKIRFALAGCGRISANHFEAIAAHGGRMRTGRGVRRGSRGPRGGRAEDGRARASARSKRCWPATDADCVILATPSGLHAEQAIRVAAAAAGTS